MTAKDLDAHLRAVPVPAKPPEYWEEFPLRVRAACSRPQGSEPTATGHWQQPMPGRLPWNWLAPAAVAGFVLAGAVLGFLPSTSRISREEEAGYSEVWREVDALFPHQVRSVVFGPGGPELVLSEQANLPAEPTLVVRGCGPAGCTTALTRSGQQVVLGGERLDVLQDAQGNVLVAGSTAVWPLAPGSLKIQARVLKGTL